MQHRRGKQIKKMMVEENLNNSNVFPTGFLQYSNNSISFNSERSPFKNFLISGYTIHLISKIGNIFALAARKAIAPEIKKEAKKKR